MLLSPLLWHLSARSPRPGYMPSPPFAHLSPHTQASLPPPHTHSLSQSKPKLYSQCLCLLYRLAAVPPSSAPMIEHLSPKNSPGLIAAAGGGSEGGGRGGRGRGAGGLRGVLVSELPPSERTHDLVAALHQRSWALRLQALLMLRSEGGDSQVREGWVGGEGKGRGGELLSPSTSMNALYRNHSHLPLPPPPHTHTHPTLHL